MASLLQYCDKCDQMHNVTSMPAEPLSQSQSDEGHWIENMVVPGRDRVVKIEKIENMEVHTTDTVVETVKPVSILKKTKHDYDRTELVDTNGTPAKVIFTTDTDSDDSAICLKNDLAPIPGT